MTEVFINTTLVSPVNIELTLETGSSSDPSLQTTWDGSTNPQKNTFVDANDAEIITFIDDTTSTVKNSDESYLITPSIGDIVVIPNITLTKNDNTTVSAVAAIDLDLGVIDPFPSDWNGLIASLGRGYTFPNITETVSFRIGDAAWVKANVLTIAVMNAETTKIRNTLEDYYTLSETNAFGTTRRFTNLTGGQIYTDYLLDNYTGMAFSFAAQTAAATWELSIDAALGSDFGGSQALAGFDDWFMCPASILFDIFRFANNNESKDVANAYPLLWATNIMSSTTRPNSTLSYYRFNFNVGTIVVGGKTVPTSYILCRKHF